jgi:hypothetical protein
VNRNCSISLYAEGVVTPEKLETARKYIDLIELSYPKDDPKAQQAAKRCHASSVVSLPRAGPGTERLARRRLTLVGEALRKPVPAGGWPDNLKPKPIPQRSPKAKKKVRR